MKRYLVPLVAGLAVFGMVTAFAATLNVGSKSLGSGDATVTSCNANASVSYTTAFVGGSYKVATAPVTTPSGCATKDYKVTLTGAAGSLAEQSGTLNSSGGDTVDFSSFNIPAHDVTGISVVITG